jgi:chitinase
MKRILRSPKPVLAVVGVAAAVLIAVQPAHADVGRSPGGSGHPAAGDLREGMPLPQRIAAPYVDVTEVSDLAQISADSGSKYLTLAFLQTEAPGSCTPYWAGDTSKPASAAVFGDAISRIRANGGDVIPSFGGYSADTTGTDIADSCTDVHKLAQAYESVVTAYKVHRLDLDVEADSISNTAGVDRRNQAIHEVQQWGRAHHWPVSFSYTLPSAPTGLVATGLAILASAAKYGADIATVNVMTFDYWDGAQHDMLADAEQAATALTAQLHQTILPKASTHELWRHVGIVQMNGIDDFGLTEVFPVSQVAPLVSWAKQKGVQTLSFWALQRDNGSCPGTVGSNSCSGVAQSTWAYSQGFATFNPRH